MRELDSYIADSMDEAMEYYAESNDYHESQRTINRDIELFCSTLTEEQKTEFRRLIDKINDADSIFSERAYEAGVINGIEFRERILGK